MFAQIRLNELRARKELLLVQAEAHRRLLALEAQNAATALKWVDSLHGFWRRMKPLAWLAAPAAGFYLARHGRSVWRWGLRLVRVWRWIGGIRRACV